MSRSDEPSAHRHVRPGLLLILLAYLGFISLGLPDAVTGVAWPGVRDGFALHQEALGLILLASGLGYFVSSFNAGRLTHAVGVGTLLAISTALVAASMFGLALAPIWAIFLLCAVVYGLGSGAIDAGLNGYAAEHLSARHMNWLHACYCFGAMLGPWLMTGVLVAGKPYQLGYALLGSALATLSMLFVLTRPRWGSAHHATPTPASPVTAREAWRHPTVRLQVLIFVLYTGLEAALSQWAFTVLTESRGVDPGPAGGVVGLYWACIGVGRIVFGMLADRIGIDRLLRYCLLAAGAGVVLFALPVSAEASYAALMLAGFGLAPVYPCLMTRTPQRLGKAVSSHAVGFQVAGAMVGAAVIPATLGVLAGQLGLSAVPIGAVVVAVAVWVLHEWLVRRG